MNATTETKNTSYAAEPVEKLYMENTLLRVFGALFCHDPKRAHERTGTIELNRGVKQKNISIRLDPEFGQPGPFAHKVTIGLLKKHSDFGLPARREVSFSERELMRLTGRTSWGGRDSDELTLALKQIRHTHILAHFKSTDRFVEHDFSIFNEVLIERRTDRRGPIVACAVVLADPIISALQDNHFTCLNYVLLNSLGTIGQALYMHLFYNFAIMYDGHHKQRLTFRKQYADICAEWLGGLTVHQQKSVVEHNQLGSHLRQLVQAGFLASYAVEKAETRDGLVITFRPGQQFFTDYDRFYRSRHQGGVQFKFHDDQQEVTEPLKVAYLFIEKRTGQPVRDIPYVSSKEVETARHLLAQVPFEEVQNFLDYALAEAKKTRFDVQTLGGLKQYLTGYRQSRERRATAAAARQTREREEADRLAYDRYRRAAAEQLFASLPATERALIEDLARTGSRPFTAGTGSLATTIYEISKARIAIERHPDKVVNFDEWRTVGVKH